MSVFIAPFLVRPMVISPTDISPEPISEFCLTGQFLAFVFNQGKLKYLRLAVTDQELEIKLSKRARASLFRLKGNHPAILQPWQTVKILGIRKLSRKGKLKWKANHIQSIELEGDLSFPGDWKQPCDGKNNHCQMPATDRSTNSPEISKKEKRSKAQQAQFKILTCHKSGCAKRGGTQQCKTIATLLHERGLAQQVAVETTGCLGKCSMAPNLLLMPGKKRLSGMKPTAIVDLIERLYHSSASFKEDKR